MSENSHIKVSKQNGDIKENKKTSGKYTNVCWKALPFFKIQKVGWDPCK